MFALSMPLHNYLFLFVQTISQLLFELAEKKMKNVKASADPKMKGKIMQAHKHSKKFKCTNSVVCIVFSHKLTVCI